MFSDATLVLAALAGAYYWLRRRASGIASLWSLNREEEVTLVTMTPGELPGYLAQNPEFKPIDEFIASGTWTDFLLAHMHARKAAALSRGRVVAAARGVH